MGQADVITEAQRQIAVVCSHFYATLGSLQRDAPPSSVKGEALLGPTASAQASVSQQTRTMAQQVTQASKQLEEWILQLPDNLESEEHRLQELHNLQQQHAQAGQELNAALQQAQDVQAQVQDCFADIIDRQLHVGT